MKFCSLLCLLVASVASLGETPSNPRVIAPELKAALEKLKLPGVTVNAEEWCVDVESRVCLTRGLLELIACTKDGKVHESIIAIDAKPSHIHAALLLLGAKPGSPATQEMIDPEIRRFRSTPPSGSPVSVFLTFKDAEGKQVEHPISDFIKAADDHDSFSEPPPAKGAKKKFPSHTFLFAGSVLVGEGEGPRQYLCDTNGNVISISTFGDELLCLPGFHEQANGSLMWQVDDTKLPELGSKILLRLRPLDAKKPADTLLDSKVGGDPAGK